MKNLIWLSAYLIISAIFSSCSKDDENTSIIPEGEKTNVNVSLNIAPINAMETNINDNRTSIENFSLFKQKNLTARFFRFSNTLYYFAMPTAAAAFPPK